MTEKLLERQLVEIWQNQLLEKTALATEDGETLEIIYPGRINDGRGADFRDAVIATKRGLLKGDVELHVKSNAWYQHRHHLNSDYNRIILHVVMWHDGKTVTSLEDGRIAPILALDKYMNRSTGQLSDLSSYPATAKTSSCQDDYCIPIKSAGAFLDRAGEERFLEKVTSYRTQLNNIEPEQVLYQGIMEALGYSRNKLCFQSLAQRLPLRKLTKITRWVNREDECLAHQQALLLGTAGLLLSQRGNGDRKNLPGEEWVDKLEELWSVYYNHESDGVMDYRDWQFYKVRPSNSPVRRLAAITHLELGYRRKGIFDTVVERIEAMSGYKAHRHLEQVLLVKADSYWVNHYDFGQPWRSGSHTLLGQGLARIITVNVLLPFVFTWGELISNQRLSKNALEIFDHYPRLPLNTIDRHMMRQMGLTSCLVDSARRQQGLLHIYKNLCSQGQCNTCRFKQSQSRESYSTA